MLTVFNVLVASLLIIIWIIKQKHLKFLLVKGTKSKKIHCVLVNFKDPIKCVRNRLRTKLGYTENVEIDFYLGCELILID